MYNDYNTIINIIYIEFLDNLFSFITYTIWLQSTTFENVMFVNHI